MIAISADRQPLELEYPRTVPRMLTIELHSVLMFNSGRATGPAQVGAGDAIVEADRERLLFEELQAIHQELQALRADFARQGLSEEINERISEIEVEQRLQAIQHEIEESAKPKKGRFRRS